MRAILFLICAMCLTACADPDDGPQGAVVRAVLEGNPPAE